MSYNETIVEEFHANEGRVGGPFAGMSILLLHHRGARTGAERINPLAYQRLSDDSVAIFASKGGAPTNPHWLHNLRANPEVSVEIGTETRAGRARVAGAEERTEIWERQKRERPQFEKYEEQTRGIREIPVVVIDLV